MTMNPVPKPNQSSEEAIQEFLDNGGKIQVFEYGQRSAVEYKNSFYGKRKKQEPTVEADIDDDE